MNTFFILIGVIFTAALLAAGCLWMAVTLNARAQAAQRKADDEARALLERANGGGA